MPQNPFIIATETIRGDVYVFGDSKYPFKPPLDGTCDLNLSFKRSKHLKLLLVICRFLRYMKVLWNARNAKFLNDVYKDSNSTAEEIKVLKWRWTVHRLKIEPFYFTNKLGTRARGFAGLVSEVVFLSLLSV
ncbi:WD-40 repeat-containing protein MSI1-like [Trifolium pratense]|uniref:WD-40 repeat-containing protein MSI1-like n=1 Tax=Trifolium pratense TaxID=57577 RepID=A0A2K3M664_TRIPR|nr:WD-40 repeat-containing protein MSI1-like [Trifolium pratense]